MLTYIGHEMVASTGPESNKSKNLHLNRKVTPFFGTRNHKFDFEFMDDDFQKTQPVKKMLSSFISQDGMLCVNSHF